ncbi:hypothetical protein FRACYDRAFT_233726 [Fragilariopsis cylindrus CCMP1102]|uniref:Uncharacterized protein n=1 Tax=Fragilariopsis cylindrus CCMP1102 TaxID=635003 RepID=A0A1E7FZG8_9STRA|nr:hypothetical protein FRACYDRAFT_233726 [Fragilariopsis cylindrus CCMP1102]|eukprot:OEU23552.1 hypothetical protein FRACYDRAFT_233726 [Fragilariopsis cylindrus CCMP1102]
MTANNTVAVDSSNNSNSNSNSINSSLLKKIKKMNDVLTDVVGGNSSTTSTTNTSRTATPPTPIITRTTPLTHLSSTSTISSTTSNTSTNRTIIITTTARQKRINMINNEIDSIMDNLKEYFGYHMMDELFVTDDIKDVLLKAAYNLAYTKIYYCCIKDKIIYFPSCQELILNYTLMEEAETYYYNSEDEFPIEYSKGLRTVVSSSKSNTGEFRKMKENKKKGSNGYDNDDDDDSSITGSDINNTTNDDDDEEDDDEDNTLGSDIIERLAMPWTEALDDNEEKS